MLEIKISTVSNISGISDSNIISAEKFSLKLRAFVNVLLATVKFPMPFSTKRFATSSIVSPAPITRAWASSKLEKIFGQKGDKLNDVLKRKYTLPILFKTGRGLFR